MIGKGTKISTELYRTTKANKTREINNLAQSAIAVIYGKINGEICGTKLTISNAWCA